MGNLKIRKQAERGLSISTVETGTLTDIRIAFNPAGINEDPSSVIARVDALLKKNKAEVVKCDLFGPPGALAAYAGCLERICADPACPVTDIVAAPYPGAELAGLQIHAVAGVPVRTIFLAGKPAARVYEDSSAKYCAIGNALPDDSGAPRDAQALAALIKLERTLGLAGLGVRDIVRTWFFLDDILPWYGDFNAVRGKFFKERNIAASLAPASTGIGAMNSAHTALVAGALAVRPKLEAFTVKELPSPMQCPAPAYGSLFSRAVEIGGPACRSVLVSGTASIGAAGETIHAGDVGGQIAHTLKVVEAILASRCMDFTDITRATAYFRNAAALSAFEKHRNDHCLPAILVQSVICRDDLLFEIEVDAVSQKAVHGESRCK